MLVGKSEDLQRPVNCASNSYIRNAGNYLNHMFYFHRERHQLGLQPVWCSGPISSDPMHFILLLPSAFNSSRNNDTVPHHTILILLLHFCRAHLLISNILFNMFFDRPRHLNDSEESILNTARWCSYWTCSVCDWYSFISAAHLLTSSLTPNFLLSKSFTPRILLTQLLHFILIDWLRFNVPLNTL